MHRARQCPVLGITENSHPLTQRTLNTLAPLEGTLGPLEGAMWDYTGTIQLTYDPGGTAIIHEATTPAQQ